MSGATMGLFAPVAAIKMALTAQDTASGCTGVKTATGVYTITLSQGADEHECLFIASLQAAAATAVGIVVSHTSDTVKVVKTFDAAAAAADCAFDFLVVRFRGGGAVG